MNRFHPLTFKPNLHSALWGGESWEISGHPVSPSVVADGPFAGRTLEELAREYGAAFTGTKAPVEGVFPLLFKVIDAKQRLSVQVHPNERTRALTGGEPKTEMWRVLGGRGPIFAGLKPGTTPARVEEDVRTGRFEETLVRHDAREGLTLFIPGGLVHAIGEDVLIYEVQQSSNTTYRLYDWGRVGADGKPRQLHVAESLKSIDFDLPVPTPRDEVRCPFFNFRAVESAGAIEIAADPATFTALFIVNERRSVLVPANCAARVPCTGTVLVTTL
ncbi:MAG: type I phosphomannose isomerase catalytic subunit [Kiritimatiellia bacterium]